MGIVSTNLWSSLIRLCRCATAALALGAGLVFAGPDRAAPDLAGLSAQAERLKRTAIEIERDLQILEQARRSDKPMSQVAIMAPWSLAKRLSGLRLQTGDDQSELSHPLSFRGEKHDNEMVLIWMSVLPEGKYRAVLDITSGTPSNCQGALQVRPAEREHVFEFKVGQRNNVAYCELREWR